MHILRGGLLLGLEQVVIEPATPLRRATLVGDLFLILAHFFPGDIENAVLELCLFADLFLSALSLLGAAIHGVELVVLLIRAVVYL